MAKPKDDKQEDTAPEQPGAMSATPSELAAQDVADKDTSDDTSEDSAAFFARMTGWSTRRR